ncbi:MAG: hypothetical protein R3E01_26565 [Pirellulaceae bacterium]
MQRIKTMSLGKTPSGEAFRVLRHGHYDTAVSDRQLLKLAMGTI